MDALISTNMALRAELAAAMANLTALFVSMQGGATCPTCPPCNNVCTCRDVPVFDEAASLFGLEAFRLHDLLAVGLILTALTLLRSPVMALFLVTWGQAAQGKLRAVIATVCMVVVDPAGALTYMGVQIWEAATGIRLAGLPSRNARGGGGEPGSDADAEAPAGADADASGGGAADGGQAAQRGVLWRMLQGAWDGAMSDP